MIRHYDDATIAHGDTQHACAPLIDSTTLHNSIMSCAPLHRCLAHGGVREFGCGVTSRHVRRCCRNRGGLLRKQSLTEKRCSRRNIRVVTVVDTMTPNLRDMQRWVFATTFAEQAIEQRTNDPFVTRSFVVLFANSPGRMRRMRSLVVRFR